MNNDRGAVHGRRAALMSRITNIATDQFYCMGVVMLDGLYGIFKNSLGNTPGRSSGGGRMPT